MSASTKQETEVPYTLSRQKALQLLRGNNAVASKEARESIYELYFKIGARGELPPVIDKHDRAGLKAREGVLSEIWRNIYLNNKLCPGDIPFPIIISEFTGAMVLGLVERKGNNLAAIVQSFNSWITRQKVLELLYAIRNRLYPHWVPEAIEERKSKPLHEMSDEEIENRIEKLKPFKHVNLTLEMISMYRDELSNRKTKHHERVSKED